MDSKKKKNNKSKKETEVKPSDRSQRLANRQQNNVNQSVFNFQHNQDQKSEEKKKPQIKQQKITTEKQLTDQKVKKSEPKSVAKNKKVPDQSSSQKIEEPPIYTKGSLIALKGDNKNKKISFGLLLEDFRKGDKEVIANIFQLAIPLNVAQKKVPITEDDMVCDVDMIDQNSQDIQISYEEYRRAEKQLKKFDEISVEEKEDSAWDGSQLNLSEEAPKNRRKAKQIRKSKIKVPKRQEQRAQSSARQSLEETKTQELRALQDDINIIQQDLDMDISEQKDQEQIEDQMIIDTSTRNQESKQSKKAGSKRKTASKVKDDDFNLDDHSSSDEIVVPTKRVKAETKKPEKVEEYKKGKWNPFIELVGVDQYKEGADNQLYLHCCIRCNNKNIIRAAITGNENLLMKGIGEREKISSLTAFWSPEIYDTSIEYLFFKNNIQLIDNLLKFGSQELNKRVKNPDSLLSLVDTGNVSTSAYGYKVRKVQMTKGNKQGNNALVQYKDNDIIDPSVYVADEQCVRKILHSPKVQFKTIKEVMKINEKFEKMCFKLIYEAVRAGNQQLAFKLIKRQLKKDKSFGFTKLHKDVLDHEFGLTGITQQEYIAQTQYNQRITPIHCACINPDPKFLKAIIDSDAYIDSSDSDQRRPIHYAAACTSPEPLKLLLIKGINLVELDNEQRTCVHIAAITGRAENINIILQRNSGMVNMKDSRGMTAIAYACKYGHIEAVDALLKNRASINVGVGQSKIPPLNWAATYGHYELTEFLLNNKARVLGKDTYNRSALVMAARNGHAKIVSLLLQRGADFTFPDSSMNTPLHHACAYGWTDCVDQIIKAGADINAQNSWKLSPINTAMLNNHSGCVKRLLVQPFIDVNVKDEQGRTLIMLSLLTINEYSLDLIQHLVKKGANLNMQDINGNTALHYLAKFKPETLKDSDPESQVNEQKIVEIQKRIALLLLSFGSDFNIQNNEGETPFSISFKISNFQMMEVLIDRQVLDNQPLLLFQFKDHILNIEYQKMLENLIKNSPPSKDTINFINDEGFTPFLAYIKQFDVLKYTLTTRIEKEIDNQMKEFGDKLENYHLTNADLFETTEKLNTKQNLNLNQVKVDEEELKLKRKLVSEFFDNIVVKPFIQFLDFFISKGADPHAQVQKLKQYRELEKKKLEEQLKQTEIDQEMKEVKENKQDEEVLDKRLQEIADKYSKIIDKTLKERELKQKEKDQENFNFQLRKEYGANGLQNAVFLLIQNPSKLLLEYLISLKVNCDLPDITNTTPFEFFIRSFGKDPTKFDTMDVLLKQKVQVDRPNAQGFTPFLEYFEQSKYEIAYKLLDFGADINHKAKNGYFALKYAYARKEEEHFNLLLKRGANINLGDIDGENLLFDTIVEMQGLKPDKYLTQIKNLDTTVKDPNNKKKQDPKKDEKVTYMLNMKVIKESEDQSNKNLVKFLKDIDFDIDSIDKDGFNKVIIDEQRIKDSDLYLTKKALSQLLKKGCNINHTDNNGQCLIFKVINSLQWMGVPKGSELINFLIENKINLNLKNKKGENAINACIQSMDYDSELQCMEILINKGCNVTSIDDQGMSILHIFIKKMKNLDNIKTYKYIKLFVENGAKVNQLDYLGRNVLHHIFEKLEKKNENKGNISNIIKLVSYLIEKGIKLNQQDCHLRTPLHYVFVNYKGYQNQQKYDPYEIINFLCDQKSLNVNLLDIWKMSPLHYSAKKGAVISSTYLIQKGASIETQNLFGNDQFAIALQSGHYDYCMVIFQQLKKIDSLVFQDHQDLIKNKFDEKKQAKEKRKREEKKKVLDHIKKKRDLTDKDLEGIEFEEKVSQKDQDLKEVQKLIKFIKAFEMPEKREIISLFQYALKKNQMPLAYLILEKGFDLKIAVEQAMEENKIEFAISLLRKFTQKQIVHELVPLYFIKGKLRVTKDLDFIYQNLKEYGVNSKTQDYLGNSILHYAVTTQNCAFVKSLLNENEKYDPNLKNKEGQTPLSLYFNGFYNIKGQFYKRKEKKKLEKMIIDEQKEEAKFEQLENIFTLLCNYGADVNIVYPEITYKPAYSKQEVSKNFKDSYDEKVYSCSPLIHLIRSHREFYKEYLISNIAGLIRYGADLNIKDSDGRDAISHCAISNNIGLLEYILNKGKVKSLPLKNQDKAGKSAAHFVVNPLEYGSYENVEILKVLHKFKFELTLKDAKGNTPVYYSNLQESGVLKQEFINLLGYKIEKLPAIQSSEKVDFPKQNVNFEADARKFMEIAYKKQLINGENKQDVVPVDETGNFSATHKVYVDENDKPWDAYLTKVNINFGINGDYVFYRIQLLYDSNQDLYIVFTRWGRIGEDGMNQRSPFTKLRDAKEEFKKTFEAKTGGNSFDNLENFRKVKEKYNLIKVNYHPPSYKEYLQQLDFEKCPKSKLPPSLYTLFKEIANVTMYQRAITQLGFQGNSLSCSGLNKETLLKAKEILFQINDLLQEDINLTKKGVTANFETLGKIKEDIIELTNRYYELIPRKEFINRIPPPFTTLQEMKHQYELLENLLSIELTTQILLGALLNQFEINPADYIFNALGMQIVPMDTETSEFKILKTYIDNTNTQKDYEIQNIFKIQRRGEAEQIQEFRKVPNHYLLYHGTKLFNFIGIMNQGLQIAPLHAPKTGYALGKGLYFADMFDKSFWYCQHNYGQESMLMLMCEVVLGKSKELQNYEYVESLDSSFHSVKGCGREGPNPDDYIVMPNGVKVPQGKVVKHVGNWLQHNEFVVYNHQQARMRYLIQIRKKPNEV